MFFKRVLLPTLVALAFTNITGTSPITFTSHKNSDMSSLTQQFLQQIHDIFNISLFVETGTYYGGTTVQAAPVFSTIHTIELYEPLAEAAMTKFSNQKNITVHKGSSPDIFRKILPILKEQSPILFFLDAHYCGGTSAVDKEGEKAADGITAIRKELAAIYESGVEDCVIMIDDIRGFGTQTEGKEYLGCWAYPPLQDICNRLLTINRNFSCMLIGDILLAFDKTRYNVPLSPVVMACTISRLFDGTNSSQEEVLEAEYIISTAKGEEKAFIEKLYKNMTQYKDPEFHHDLWYGLLCLNDKKYAEAVQEFNKVEGRGYNHPRIQQYLALAEAH